MSLHKFILESHRDGAATLWYSTEGRLYPVKRFSKEDQEDEDQFEDAAITAAHNYIRRFG